MAALAWNKVDSVFFASLKSWSNFHSSEGNIREGKHFHQQTCTFARCFSPWNVIKVKINDSSFRSLGRKKNLPVQQQFKPLRPFGMLVCVCVSLYILRPFIAAKQLSGNDLKNSAELAHLPFAVLLFLLFFYLGVNFYKGTSFGSFFSPYFQVSLWGKRGEKPPPVG